MKSSPGSAGAGAGAAAPATVPGPLDAAEQQPGADERGDDGERADEHNQPPARWTASLPGR
ncbi:hypothetical protein [Streptomyces sp. SID8352]|uniref:hypothetical protein n=1 Tax=Streptomyces sp. SID8352 TaxID=2690338 RepID=UPI001F30C83C|nr:hypothetical protein [Streptomyces sp. SID8352]